MVNRAEKRALEKMGIPPALAQVPTKDTFGQLTFTALLSAVKSDCECKTCKILRRMADRMVEEAEEEEEDA